MVFVPVYKPEPDALQKQAAGIARRRALEAQRKARIFDPKTRVIGVDVASLDALVAERREREQDERRRDRAFDQQSVEIARQLTELQRIRQRKILERNAQVQDYRARSQKVEDRRDYDLYDPALLRKQRPPRNGDDVDLPASSLQMFNGEDLHKRDRVRQQQRELSQWVRGSLAERDAIRADEVACEQAYAEQVAQVDAELERLQQSKQTNARVHSVQVQNFNRDLDVVVHRARDEVAKRSDEVARKEVQYNLGSAWLNERYETTRRVNKPSLYTSSQHAYIPWNFKGYSAAERQSILDAQAAQIEEKRALKAAEDARNAEQDKELAAINRELLLTARARQRNDLKHRLDVRHEQEQQRMEFKKKYDYINNELYQNKVDDYVFDCFGTSTR
ncbi:RIB43A-like with coiled-coils protein 2 [Plasmodiophora brassicae]|uniref:RIB43A-like with coiled-coils protein 2 n=1 Tax=Plasmodiophora brassicae TaxID=37360 RepID=A0A0G4J503_PLABS|nr:hypothetical protein PBRA_009058 [Plasmodiophora brassicae]SPQ96977.1 unnamed protein product [Plasmodiophora brassicae]